MLIWRNRQHRVSHARGLDFNYPAHFLCFSDISFFFLPRYSGVTPGYWQPEGLYGVCTSQLKCEFLDINPKVERVIQGRFEIDVNNMVVVKSSPWRSSPGTLVGTSKFVIRQIWQEEGSFKWNVRAMGAVEYMRLIGWDIDDWRPCHSTQERIGAMNPVDWIELVAEMVGNAWCVFQYGPIRCALTATIGHFMKDGDGVENDTISEEESDSSDASMSD